MNVSIIGGGNIGTLMAADAAKKGNRVTIYTAGPSQWSREIKVLDNMRKPMFSAEIFKITSDLREAVSDGEIIFVTYPAFAFEKLAEELDKVIDGHKMIGIIPGSGGAEFAFKRIIDKGHTLFGFQRVHSIARMEKRGEAVCMLGRKDDISIAAIPGSEGQTIADIISEMFDMPCHILPNYLCLTLTPSNPVLHTSRLYTMFKDYNKGVTYKKNILFYEEWTDEASDMLIACDDEVQEICRTIPLELNMVKSLKKHYESENAAAMTKKIRSITAFKGLGSPMIKSGEGYIPDFDSRYFTADFSYGLKVLKDIGKVFGIKTPNLDKMWEWYLTFRTYGESGAKPYFTLNITERNEFLSLYKK